MSELRKAAQAVVNGYFHEVPSLYNDDIHHKNISHLETVLGTEPDWCKLVQEYFDARDALQDAFMYRDEKEYPVQLARSDAATEAIQLALQEQDNE